MIPIHVISKPDAHQDRMVISDFNAPTAKCAAKLIPKEMATAVMPPEKKNGMIGTKAPIEVETAAEIAAVHGLGKRCSDKPSSLCAMACTNCSGCSARRSAICCDSSGVNPCTW